jgi:hypothetical protein
MVNRCVAHLVVFLFVVFAGRRGIDDCTAVVGDRLWTTMKWKGGDDVGIEPGQAIGLRVEMYQAKLYGLDFE